MATLLKVLNNLADIKSVGVLHFASELRPQDSLALSEIGSSLDPMRVALPGQIHLE